MDDCNAGAAGNPPTKRLYHGTRAELKPGDLIEPSNDPGAGAQETAPAYVFLTANLDEAIWDAEIADGEGRARVYTVEPKGDIGQVSVLTGRRAAGHPSMSCCSREPLRVTGEVTDWRLYHGTRADLKVGDLIRPGHAANFGDEPRTANHVYFSRTMDAAMWGAELAAGDGRGRIYIVEPTGPIEDDPNLTNKKFRGNPTKSFRSRAPVRVIGEIQSWHGHSPEAIKAMKNGLERLNRLGTAEIDD